MEERNFNPIKEGDLVGAFVYVFFGSHFTALFLVLSWMATLATFQRGLVGPPEFEAVVTVGFMIAVFFSVLNSFGLLATALGIAIIGFHTGLIQSPFPI